MVVENPPASAGDVRDASPIPEWGRSPGGGHGNPLQYSCLENPMDRGAWRATFQMIAKSQTRLSGQLHLLRLLLGNLQHPSHSLNQSHTVLEGLLLFA